jgi:hypothetical protein
MITSPENKLRINVAQAMGFYEHGNVFYFRIPYESDGFSPNVQLLASQEGLSSAV